MTICTFAGHRQVFSPGLPERLDAAIEALLVADVGFLFYSGGMGEFDDLCAAAVRRAKQRHPALNIRLMLVLPYMTHDLNARRDFYESRYDGIFVPVELMGAHYKGAIKKRNRWLIDHSNLLFAYVRRNFGGAYEMLQYAKKRSALTIVHFAEQALFPPQ